MEWSAHIEEKVGEFEKAINGIELAIKEFKSVEMETEQFGVKRERERERERETERDRQRQSQKKGHFCDENRELL